MAESGLPFKHDKNGNAVTEVSRPSEKSYDIADPRYIEDLSQWRASAEGRGPHDSQRNVWLARPERRRQVYANAHPGHLAGARWRQRPTRRDRRPESEG